MLQITPEKFGHVDITPTGPFEAGSFQSISLVYTTGFYGIDDTGGIKVVFRRVNDQTAPQFTHPEELGYTTLELPDHVEGVLTYDPHGNQRPWNRVLQVKLTKGNLRQGDTIKICIGDQRQGSKGIRLQTFCENASEFRVLVDCFSVQNYQSVPNPASFQITSGEPLRWVAVLPTYIGSDDTFRLSFKVDDSWGNPCNGRGQTLKLKSNMPVLGLPETVCFEPGKKAYVIEGLKTDDIGCLTVSLSNEDGIELVTSNPMRIRHNADLRHFWGDLHGQSAETVGTNTARDYFQFALDLSFLDITAHQGNDFQITESFWQELNRLTHEFTNPNRFVVLPGYEWSGNTNLGGDRNVYYLNEGCAIRRSSHALVRTEPNEPTDCCTAEILFNTLLESKDPVVTYAHVGGRYADLRAGHNGKIEQSVEIHSAWGTFEWLLHDAFDLGYRMGIVANSDDHKGRPGASYPGASLFGAYGGLTCFLMPELTRKALFESLQRRHHYATTGTRLFLDVRVGFENPAEIFHRDPLWHNEASEPTDTAIMGDIVAVSDNEVDLSVTVDAPCSVERIEVYDGRELVEIIRNYKSHSADRRIRILMEGAEHRGRGRIVKWDGRLIFKNNSVTCLKPINFWNPEQQPELTSDGSISFKAITTGNSVGFDVWLADERSGEIVFESNQTTFNIQLS
ncbi:MAG: DUF3604 domain-containing protein, partial [Calditrichaeota bacterium]|nr:DUF3604 domain-containing protein [Calditrichota bacterium]